MVVLAVKLSIGMYIDDSIVDIYMTKAKTTREDITQKVEEETWFTASEAVEIGFADKISESEPTTPATNLI
ncbi:ATP-dependent Clp protease proteolytic subunit [Aneurinibacillus thermoaerophilus]|uniref:ATP-dependent Clp protease proteolytic subunit n=2 Tax=Aneurinibacillus thermoaerophilus TaxID=143495 RepID=UPI002E23A744|nr:ATP-dependent Clp protease proteolytic subunit [Aneurinibacillus thermoaerophilus]